MSDSGFLWEILGCWKPEKNLSNHINIQKKGSCMAVEMILGEMIEKSLKQREQLEGYRRDAYIRKLQEEQEKKKLIKKGYISSYE